MADVTDLFLHAQALRAAGERVVSTDERTGIQALERTHPPIPMGPGRAEPQATRWHVVADHLNLHQSESLGRFVAEHDGVTDNLGKKEQHGMLQSMATRAALLSDPTPRLVFHSTPKQASWMNQREMWCSIVVRQLLKRASCTSVDD